jgi:hypothetical protein
MTDSRTNELLLRRRVPRCSGHLLAWCFLSPPSRGFGGGCRCQPSGLFDQLLHLRAGLLESGDGPNLVDSPEDLTLVVHDVLAQRVHDRGDTGAPLARARCQQARLRDDCATFVPNGAVR